jgi:hypothetical protein
VGFVEQRTLFTVPDLGKPMTLGPNSLRIRGDSLKFVDRFLYYYLSGPRGRSQIDSITEVTAQPKFNKTNLRNLVIPLPSRSEQQRILDLLVAVDVAADGALRVSRSASAMRGSLVGVLLRGDHEIPASYDRLLDDAA